MGTQSERTPKKNEAVMFLVALAPVRQVLENNVVIDSAAWRELAVVSSGVSVRRA
ncbi:hypothetical protein HPT27_17765 [Permianibacter sp. IMCC34836]|uniref:hypothetical protein n=1 Tax=Permianibacter fluminis TaxID=2738515 RepID=UPI0015547315|nr:hypothetical protein [Permianibacter fluminis]NQD38867.1 hypothetical protein [Permianibacter fluminis]